MDKDIDAFRTISEVAEDLDLPQHVLRFWELRFPQIKPMKRSGGRRYYRPEDLELLRGIKHLLYGQGYTIKGVQRILKEQGVRAVAGAVPTGEDGPPARKEPGLRSRGPALRPPSFEAADDEDEPDAAPAPALPDAPMRIAPMRIAPVGMAPLRDDHAQRLRAALLDVEECGRILAAAREG